MADHHKMIIQALSEETFAPFGKIIHFSTNLPDERFEVLIEEQVSPWRIAVFRVRQRETDKLEAHPSSMETFEPMGGMGLLLVAAPDAPHSVHAFALDQPVCLWKGVWHEVIALSQEALYKITENAQVDSVFYSLDKTIGGWAG